MWPFEQLSRDANVPTTNDMRDLKIATLEQYIIGLEKVIIELCYAIKAHNEITDQNFRTMQKNFENLADFVLRPRDSIRGDQKDTN
jgi:hypothetical protein